MQAIIMAGGKGTRLQDLTEDAIPKPLIKLHQRPILDYVLNHVIKNGCDNIIICTGHQGYKIHEYLEKNNYDVAVRISQEKKLLGTAGALHLIEDLLEEVFFVIYADVFSTINLKKMFHYHKKKKADVTIAVHTSDHPQDSTVVKIDDDGKYLEMIEKPGDNWKKYGNLTQTSLYIVNKEVLHFIPQNTKVDFEKYVFPKMKKAGKRIYGYQTEEYAKDIGTPERYQSVVSKLKIHQR